VGGYNTARLSLNTPLSQQQRFNLMHSFHRSPFVAPQHPFNSNTPAAVAAWSTSNPSSVIEEDWIDDEEINPATSSSLLLQSPSHNPIATAATVDKKSTEMDFQVHMLISYKGDMSMTIMTELRMNYPSVMFMSLPINLCVKSVEFEATAVVAYIQSMNRVCVSMLEPEDSAEGLNAARGKDIGMDR
jgi:distribution and morphology protein 12